MKTAFHHTASKQLNFFSTQHARFRQLKRMNTAFNKFESTTLLSLRYLATTCLWRKAWTICELYFISDKCHDVTIGQPESEKPYNC